MRKKWIVLLLILIVIPSVQGAVPSSEVKVLDITQMPEDITFTDLSLDIEFEIENTGYEKVLITLPSDLSTLHSDNIDGAQGQAIMLESVSRMAFKEKWGDKDDFSSFRNTHFVMTSATPISRGASLAYPELGETKRGWYIRPNERLMVHIKVTSTGTGIINPFSLEKDLPFIEVTKFSAIIRFEPNASTYGFVTAPYVVKDATLITSYPSIFADANDFDASEYYWETFKLPETEETREIDVVDWDDWFTTSSSPLTISSIPLTSTLLATTDLDYYPIEKVEKTTEDEEIFIPIWHLPPPPDLVDFVIYEYQWRKNFEISGVYLDYLKEPPRVAGYVPEWHYWF
ncbi:MAG: hypothetical protein ACE5J5_06425 [Candidatus Hydrothermarchaeales archaeon]